MESGNTNSTTDDITNCIESLSLEQSYNTSTQTTPTVSALNQVESDEQQNASLLERRTRNKIKSNEPVPSFNLENVQEFSMKCLSLVDVGAIDSDDDSSDLDEHSDGISGDEFCESGDDGWGSNPNGISHGLFDDYDSDTDYIYLDGGCDGYDEYGHAHTDDDVF